MKSLRLPILTWFFGLIVAMGSLLIVAAFWAPHFQEIQKLMASGDSHATNRIPDEMFRSFTPGMFVLCGIGMLGLVCCCVGSIWFAISLVLHFARRKGV